MHSCLRAVRTPPPVREVSAPCCGLKTGTRASRQALVRPSFHIRDTGLQWGCPGLVFNCAWATPVSVRRRRRVMRSELNLLRSAMRQQSAYRGIQLCIRAVSRCRGDLCGRCGAQALGGKARDPAAGTDGERSRAGGGLLWRCE